MAFHFRQFDVEDERSTQRVGTDAMLLGAWASPPGEGKILDIGTGCGVLALMMAQKTEAIIEAIDIDLSSVNEAHGNFRRSPWHARLFAIHAPLQVFSENAKPNYDFIICNPPYFSNSLKSPSARKNLTRHDQSLSLEELIRCVSKILTPNGSFVLILPAVSCDEFIGSCIKSRMYLKRKLTILPKPALPPIRTLMEFTKTPSQVGSGLRPVTQNDLTILNSSETFSTEYLALTTNFHCF